MSVQEVVRHQDFRLAPFRTATDYLAPASKGNSSMRCLEPPDRALALKARISVSTMSILRCPSRQKAGLAAGFGARNCRGFAS